MMIGEVLSSCLRDRCVSCTPQLGQRDNFFTDFGYLSMVSFPEWDLGYTDLVLSWFKSYLVYVEICYVFIPKNTQKCDFGPVL